MSSARLRPSVEPFPASTGDIYLLRSDGGDDVVLREATPFARGLVDSLPAETTVYPGHMGITTLGAERASNPFLAELAR